jgi:hypothetical protein
VLGLRQQLCGAAVAVANGTNGIAAAGAATATAIAATARAGAGEACRIMCPLCHARAALAFVSLFLCLQTHAQAIGQVVETAIILRREHKCVRVWVVVEIKKCWQNAFLRRARVCVGDD